MKQSRKASREVQAKETQVHRSIGIYPSLLKRIKSQAERESRTTNQMINVLLERALN